MELVWEIVQSVAVFWAVLSLTSRLRGVSSDAAAAVSQANVSDDEAAIALVAADSSRLLAESALGTANAERKRRDAAVNSTRRMVQTLERKLDEHIKSNLHR